MIKEILSHYLGIEFETNECKSCMHLRVLVEQERRDKSKLLDAIIKITEPKPEPIHIPQEIPIHKPVMRTSQLREQLEIKHRIAKEDQEKIAEIRRSQQKELEEIEKELNVG